MQKFQGSCHCRAVLFEVEGDLGQVVVCNCSICTKKGFLHLIVKKEDFVLICGESNLTEYRFNTKIARHLFCKTCGISPYYIPRSHPEKIDVNVNCLDQIDRSILRPTLFNGEQWEASIEALTEKIP